ncbi:MAG: hypothetical protein OEM46_03875 [Ignavibacteria bacterium]|nr:hypothetical protein [Ignavibacteria bacterium]
MVNISIKFIIPIVSCIIAILSFTGIILNNDITGRIIFGLCWSMITIGWIIYLFNLNRKLQ